MKTPQIVAKDPVCGMSVNEETALHAERDGKTFYFCGETCLKTFLSRPAGATQKSAKDKNGGCCG